ncbi:MAG: hypothetical protein MR293_01595 [Bacteroidales bacterium]|nr:hypothetical protein [Bacteroidales bacterium]
MKRNNLSEMYELKDGFGIWRNELVEWIGQEIDKWVKSREIACISAYRGVLMHTTPHTMGATQQTRFLTLAENATRQHDLYATLLYLGYGILSKGFEEGVNSTIVLNLQNDSRFYDNLFMLSEYYNQDAFIYKAPDEEAAYWVGTNNAPAPGYGKKVEVGYLYRKVDNELIRHVGNTVLNISDTEDVLRSMKAPSPTKDMVEAKANLERVMDGSIEQYFLKDSLQKHSMYDRIDITCTARNLIHDMMQLTKAENKQ